MYCEECEFPSSILTLVRQSTGNPKQHKNPFVTCGAARTPRLMPTNTTHAKHLMLNPSPRLPPNQHLKQKTLTPHTKRYKQMMNEISWCANSSIEEHCQPQGNMPCDPVCDTITQATENSQRNQPLIWRVFNNNSTWAWPTMCVRPFRRAFLCSTFFDKKHKLHTKRDTRVVSKSTQ